MASVETRDRERKTLVVSTHFPLPESTGGDMRTMHFVRYFQGLGRVDLAFTFGEPAGDQAATFNRVERLALRSATDLKVHVAVGAITQRPFPLYLYTSSARKAFAEMIRSRGYDYVLMRSLYPTGLVFDVPPAARRTVLLDLDDRISGTLYDQTVRDSQESAWRRTAFDGNRKLLERHERKAVRQAGVTFVCSEMDRERLTFDQPVAPQIAPNIYELASSASEGDPGFDNGTRLLFVGTLDYAPNVEGLRWFLSSIFPDFLARHPDARLSVVGRNPTAEVRSLCAANDAVDLWADVPDILSHYASCRAVVVPLLSGGGTRIKILEAASANRPVLSTRVGAEGLDLVDGSELLLFENAAEFTKSYEQLSDVDCYERLVENAHSTVKQKYSKAAFDHSLDRALGQLDRVPSNVR